MKPGEPLIVRAARRVRSLEAAFDAIARTRMRGMPTVNARLTVEAVGFEALTDAQRGTVGVAGILITPWFMNLVCLPVDRVDTPSATGLSVTRALGAESFAFIGAHDEAIGSFEACSLFSPMFEFADHAAARATALAVLAALRQAPPPPSAAAKSAAPAGEVTPARRLFLLGRAAAAP